MLDLKKIAVVGLPACGKSTFCNYLHECGAYTVDCDAIVASLLQKKIYKDQILQQIGECTNKQGTIDKKKLAAIVFNSPEKRKQLESILHPPVLEELKKYEHIATDEHSPLLAVEIPLLYEVEMPWEFDAVICIQASKEVAKKRREKDMTFTKRWERIAESLQGKKFTAIISNEGTKESLRKQAETLYNNLLT